MRPPVTSDCSLAPKLLFVDWLKILANEKQAVQFRSYYFIDPCLMYFTAINQIEISFPLLILKTKVIKFLKRIFSLGGGGLCPGSFWQGGFCPGFMSGGFLSGVFCPNTR